MIKFPILIFAFFICNTLFGQIESQGSPQALNYLGLNEIPFYNIKNEGFIKKSLYPKNNEFSRLKSDGEVLFYKVDYSPVKDGKWITTNNGYKIWVMGISTKNSVSVSVFFTQYDLIPGAKLFIYKQDQSQILGAFTYKNNKEYTKLSIAPINDSIVIIELQIPDKLADYGDLVIGELFVNLKDNTQRKALKDIWFGNSASCDIDVNCYNEEAIQQLKHSVVRIVFEGNQRCTGTLINTTRNNAHPYLLTAAHCLSTDEDAEHAIFYFDYESPVCEGSDAISSRTISGGKIIATGRKEYVIEDLLDFTLIELSERPPFYYHPVFAGWDVSNNVFDSSFVIHHPQGDVKKASVRYGNVSTGDFSSEGFKPYTHWYVESYDEGTTDKGSSGAPLFTKYGRVAGILSGGGDTCITIIEDHYQKLSESWQNSRDFKKQLKIWLDPLSIDRDTLDSYDPYEYFWSTGDTLSNINSFDAIDTDNGDLFWGYLSGHNSEGIRLFAERFLTDTVKNLVGIFINPWVKEIGNTDETITILIWKGDGYPQELIYSDQILYFNLEEGMPNLIMLDSTIKVEDEFYLGYRISYEHSFDIYANVIYSNSLGGESSSAYVYFNNQWVPLEELAGNTLNYSFDVRALVYDSVPPAPPEYTVITNKKIMLYPNPVNSRLTLRFAELPYTDAEVKIYNSIGQLVRKEIIIRPYLETTLNGFEYFSNGMYYIKVKFNNFIDMDKFVLIKHP